jgi:hypothetical protein
MLQVYESCEKYHVTYAIQYSVPLSAAKRRLMKGDIPKLFSKIVGA